MRAPYLTMLNAKEFETFCAERGLSEEAIAYIEGVRRDPPSRRVGDFAKNNVCARIPSQKTALTVQSESRTCETVFILQSELSSDVLEVWDQPQPLQLRRKKANDRLHVSSYTPDFLTLFRDRVAFVECKTRATIDTLIVSKPQDWSFKDGQIRFSPAADAAIKIGLTHEVFVAEDWSPTYLANLELLYALRRTGAEHRTSPLTAKIKKAISKAPTTIYDLCSGIRGLESPAIYQALARGEIFGAFKAQLLTQQDVFRVFDNAGDADEFQSWLLQSFRETSKNLGDTDRDLLLKATPKELAHARRLWKMYQEVLDGTRKPTRNEFRYRERLEVALAERRDPLSAFLPKFSERGNFDIRLTPAQLTGLNETIKERFCDGKTRVITQLQGHADNCLAKTGADVVSYETLRLLCLQAQKKDIAESQSGRRGYHSAMRPVDAACATLRSDTPGLLAHIDSTQFDTRVWSAGPFAGILQCPWIYTFYDEATNRALGSWMGFGKSDRYALALAIRDLVRRLGFIPPYLFQDRGAEYGSTWYETLLAAESTTKYSRPPGAPRFGGIQESSLKQINVQLAHRLAGSTWPDQQGRAASGKVKSRETARLSFEILVHEVQHFLYEIWNKTPHGVAAGTPDELWAEGIKRYGVLGRPIEYDLAFLIATSIPVKVSLSLTKGLRLAYREYWCDELDSLRKPMHLEECRLDPATPSKLYVKAQGKWFVAESRDHAKARGMSPEGQFLERYKTIEVASVNKKSRRLAAQTQAERI